MRTRLLVVLTDTHRIRLGLPRLKELFEIGSQDANGPSDAFAADRFRIEQFVDFGSADAEILRRFGGGKNLAIASVLSFEGFVHLFCGWPFSFSSRTGGHSRIWMS